MSPFAVHSASQLRQMRRNANDSPTTHSPARQSRPPRCARPCQHPQGLSRPIQEKPHSVALHSAAARALPSIAASDPDRWPGRAQTEAPCSRRTRVPQTLCRASSSAAMCVAARHRDQSSRIVTSRALSSPVAFARTFTTRLTGTAARADPNSCSPPFLRARSLGWGDWRSVGWGVRRLRVALCRASSPNR